MSTIIEEAFKKLNEDYYDLREMIFEVDSLEDWASYAGVKLKPENFEAIAKEMQAEMYESMGVTIKLSEFMDLIKQAYGDGSDFEDEDDLYNEDLQNPEEQGGSNNDVSLQRDDRDHRLTIIWDDCNPTIDRRPTLASDIRRDLHVWHPTMPMRTIIDSLAQITRTDRSYDELEAELGQNATYDEMIAEILSQVEDPGDGSPNILYLSIDGRPFEHPAVYPYTGTETLDLEHVTRSELIRNQLEQHRREAEETRQRLRRAGIRNIPGIRRR